MVGRTAGTQSRAPCDSRIGLPSVENSVGTGMQATGAPFNERRWRPPSATRSGPCGA